MRIIFSFFSLLLFANCNTSVNSSYNIFKEDSWHTDSIITIKHGVVDSTRKHSLYLKVRHNTDFEYQNIFLFVFVIIDYNFKHTLRDFSIMNYNFNMI